MPLLLLLLLTSADTGSFRHALSIITMSLEVTSRVFLVPKQNKPGQTRANQGQPGPRARTSAFAPPPPAYLPACVSEISVDP
ncbi:hypothetical protein GGR58DRAFT_479999 [Xylaria digitata]|nr:hypothetical protein GGR58DRAFT_479999 [Xylaria digitata]